MERIEITGNLGSDAEFRSESGNEYVKFNVGCTDRFVKADGSKVERVTWYSCILNGKQENLIPYLKKGTKVFIRGEQKLRVYSSEKDRAMKAGANVTVRELELIGGRSELVPLELCDSNGILYITQKYYWAEKPAHGEYPTELFNPRNLSERYIVDKNGFVTPAQTGTLATANQQGANVQDENGQTVEAC